jgi:hypothetical protein
MANHLYTRPGGVWNTSTDLLAAELADLDAKSVDSLSATGGTYSMTEDMVVGGDPFVAWVFDLQTTFNGGAVFGSDVLFGDDVQFLAGISVVGAAEFQDDLGVDGILSAFGASYFDGTANFNGAADFTGATEFNDNATFNDSVTFNDGASFNGLVILGDDGDRTEVQGPLDLHGPVRMLSGSYFKKSLFQMTDGNVSRGPTTPCSEVWVKGGVLSADRTFTIVDADDDAGMDFSTSESSFDVTVKDPGGTTLCILSTSAGVLKVISAKIRRISGTWQITQSTAA